MIASEIDCRNVTQRRNRDAGIRNRAVLQRKIDLIDAGLVLDEGVADDEPAGRTVDSAKLCIDEFGAFGRQRVDGLAAMSDTSDKETAQQSSPGQLQQS